MKLISGRTEEHGKVTGVFIIASVTDFFSLQAWTNTYYVALSPSGTTHSTSVFKNATGLH